MTALAVIPFSFEDHPVRAITIQDQPWFVASDIAKALEYLTAKDMARNLDDDEKGRQIVPTPSGDQEMTIINESGLYSAILRSRKAAAKRFKKWVTSEVLPSIRKTGGYVGQPGRLTPAQQRTLQEAVSARTAGLTDQQKHLAFPRIWGGVKTTFRVPSYKELDSRQFEDALSYINHYPLEGELLLKETAVLPETRAKLNISYPISCWANGAANMPKIDQSGMVAVLVGNIIGGDYYSPIHHLLRQLEQEGYDISACKLEIMSLRSHLENLHNILRDIEHRAGYNRHFRIKA